MNRSSQRRRALSVVLYMYCAAAAGFADQVTFLAGASGTVISAVDNQFYYNVDYRPGQRQASASLQRDNISLTGSSSLTTGQLKVRSTGSVATNYGSVNAQAAAYMVDTITASGRPLGGLNLGVNLDISGTTNSSDITTNVNYILIGFYARGHYQAALDNLLDYYDPSYRLWGAAYALGSNANAVPNLDGYHYTVTGSLPDGASNIPLSVPFNLLGSDFEIHILLGSQQSGNSTTIRTWDNDFSHTVNVALTADPGVTLRADSSALVGAVPEPGSIALIPAGLGCLLLWSRRRAATCDPADGPGSQESHWRSKQRQSRSLPER